MSIPTQKDADQAIRYSFDDATNSLRVSGSFSSTNPANGDVGDPTPTQATQVGAEDPDGNLEPLHVDAAGNLLVSLADAPGSPIHVIVDSSALPTGAATSANQATEIASLASIDSKLTSPLAVTGPLTDTELRASPVDVSASALPLPTGAATSANQTTEITQLTGIHSDTTSIDGKTVHVDTGNVTVVSSSLPIGAATAANQATEIASLSSIDTKLTSPLTVTGPLTDTQLRASPVPVSAASLPLPTGAATSANQATEIASLASIDTKLTSPLTVTGPLTDTQLRATPVPVSGTITASNTANGTPGAANPAAATFIAGSDATLLRPLKTNSSGNLIVDASLAILNTNLTGINGQTPDTGNGATGLATQRVVIASNQTAFPVTVTGTVTANAGTNLNTSALALDTSVTGLQVTQGSTTSGQKGELIQGAVTTAAPTYITAQTSPLSLTTAGALRTDSSAVTQPTAEIPSTTATVTSVASSATSVSLLASNAARKTATFYNDSTQILFLKLGTTASSTSYTVQLVAGAYYELPVGKVYTGAIDGIWVSANGNVRITELT